MTRTLPSSRRKKSERVVLAELKTGPEPQSLPVSWLTGEIAVYILVVVLALGLRLANLGAYPLNDAEATQALAALEIYQGEPVTSEAYSPLMATLNSLTFVLFGPADWSARLAPALLGIILVVLPFTLRRQLGAAGALSASLVLAVSASTLFWSRTVSGDIGVAVGMFLLLAGGMRWLVERQSFGLYVIAVGLALLLSGAPAAYTALAALLLLVVVVSLTSRSAISDLQARLSEDKTALGRAGGFGGGLLLVLATAGLFNLTGLAAISDMFDRWLGQFGLQPQAGAAYPAIFTLFFYEPLILLFGGIGLIAALWNRRPFDWLLAAWTAVVIMLDLLMGGRTGGQILLVVVPLALLAGRQIGLLWEAWQTDARLDGEGLFSAIGLMVSIFVYITLVSWAKCTPAQVGCQTAWILPLAGILLIVGLGVIFGVWYGPQLAWRSLAAVLLIMMACLSVGAAWRLNYGPLKDLPFQTMIQLPASSRLPVLLNDLTRLSMERMGDARMLDIAVVDMDDPILRWQLRDFNRVSYDHDFISAAGASIILSRLEAGQPLGGTYIGQEFALVSHWSTAFLTGKEWFRWYFFRYLPNQAPGSDQLVMWVRVN